jgi:predicted Zn finger-like uncharacterized protein
MILSCPVCRTRYRVDKEALGGRKGRTVRCASCGHTWHYFAPPDPTANPGAARRETRIEPALEVPPRPVTVTPPTSESPAHRTPVAHQASQAAPRRWTASRWFLLAALIAVAIVVGIVIARSAVTAIWPPAARLYALAGLPVDLPVAKLKIEKLIPRRTPDGLIIDGDISNTGKTTLAVPRLRVALRDAAEKEVQFKVIDPPKPQLTPGAVAHFTTPFPHPDGTATGVVVTFAAR